MSLRIVLMGILFSVLWSSAFTTARMIVVDAPPFLALGVRFLISGLLGVAIALAVGQRLRLSCREWFLLIMLGLCQNTIYLGACFVAVQWVEVSVVVIIVSLLPLIVAASSWLFLGERSAWLGITGLIAGMVGVFVMMSAKVNAGLDPTGVAITLVGVSALAAATLLVGGTFSKNPNTMMLVGVQMLVGCVTVLPLSWFIETWQVNWTLSLLGAFAWTTLMPGLFATWVWFGLVAKIGPTAAAAFHFLNPFFGVLIAAMVLAEAITATDVIGVVIVMAGILAVQISRRQLSQKAR